jgi:hypothetical protein
MTKDLYVIVDKKTGKALRDRIYLTERNALKEINRYPVLLTWSKERLKIQWDKNYILCKFSLTQVREDDKWIDITERTTQ